MKRYASGYQAGTERDASGYSAVIQRVSSGKETEMLFLVFAFFQKTSFVGFYQNASPVEIQKMKKFQITAQLRLADVGGLGIFPNKQKIASVYTDAPATTLVLRM